MNVPERYSRQLPIFGKEGQKKISKTSVLVVGAGGLGSIVSTYLALAGFGKIIIVDSETVEESNLNRQLLYRDSDIGKRKAVIAAKRLKELNPSVEVVPIYERVTKSNVEKIVSMADIVVDALDNWETRFLLNEACVRLGKPLIHAGVEKFYGQLITIIPGKTPCLRCIFPKNPPEKEFIPVVGSVVGVIGSLEATEAIKLATMPVEKTLAGKLLLVNLMDYEFNILEVRRRPDCPVCGKLA